MFYNESGWLLSAANQLVTAVNRALAMAPGTQKHLKNLTQCVFKLQISGINRRVYFGVTAVSNHDQRAFEATPAIYKVQLIEPTEKVDVTLTGSPISLVKLLGSQNKALLFSNRELELQGDAVRIQQILAFLGALEIDWDGLLAEFIGDVPAHLIGSTVRSGLAWSLSLSKAFIRDAEEYIKYELRLLPDKQRASKQFQGITDLVARADALSGRLEKLEAAVTRADRRSNRP
jgi:ubiquinone biosynthesis protein UbiJ